VHNGGGEREEKQLALKGGFSMVDKALEALGERTSVLWLLLWFRLKRTNDGKKKQLLQRTVGQAS